MTSYTRCSPVEIILVHKKPNQPHGTCGYREKISNIHIICSCLFSSYLCRRWEKNRWKTIN